MTYEDQVAWIEADPRKRSFAWDAGNEYWIPLQDTLAWKEFIITRRVNKMLKDIDNLNL